MRHLAPGAPYLSTSRRATLLPVGLLLLLGATAPLVRADEPVPIQRVELPPERVGAEMERVRRQVLTQLPREQFEDLVRQAARAEAAGNEPPRLIEAHYRATVQDDGLAGTAEWKVASAHDVPGRLPLGALQLAVRSARWSDRTPAIIGTFEGKGGAGLELFVERKGERKIALEWSARGVAEPGGLRFDLRLPPCALTDFELELPPDHVVETDRDSAVLSGPLPGSNPGLRLWRLTFPRTAGAGLSARLAVRRPLAPDQPVPLLRTTTQTTERLTPGQVDCEFQFDIEVQRGDSRRLTLELDGGLRPLELQVPGLDRWSIDANDSRRIDVLLREPLHAARLTLRALAPLPSSDEKWTSPAARLVGGLPQGERLTLIVDPDLQLEDWNAGAFRPVASAADGAAAQVISLQSRSIGPGAPARPAARIRLAAGSFHTRETWDWRIEPERMTLAAEVRVLVRRGLLFDLTWQVPPGWDVDQVQAMPADAGLRWSVAPGSSTGPALLRIEPARPFGAGPDNDARRLVIRLRAPGPAWPSPAVDAAATVTLPNFAPRNADGREGTLTVRTGPTLLMPPLATQTLRPDVPLSFRGAPQASVTIRQRRGRLAARCDTEAIIRPDALSIVCQLRLSSPVAAGEELLLTTTAPVSFASWRTLDGAAQIRSIEPAPAFDLARTLFPVGAVSGWNALGHWSAAQLAAGQTWRIRFDRALAGTATFELSAEGRRAGASAEVPLLGLNGAERLDGRVVVRFAPGKRWDPEARGLLEEPAPHSSDGLAQRVFRIVAPLPQLTLRAAPDAAGFPAARVAQARLIIQPCDDGPTLYWFRFTLGGWTRRELPLRLPPGARLAAVRVNGAPMTAAAAPPEEPDALLVPWDPGREWHTAEVVYTLPGELTGPLVRVRAAAPQLPVLAAIRHVWRLPAGLLPVTSTRWQALPGGATSTLGLPAHWFGRRDPAWANHLGALSAAPRSGATLAQLIDRLALAPSDGPALVVVDTWALDRAGTAATTVVAQDGDAEPALAGLGLVVLAHPRGLLVTSRAQAESWNGTLPGEVIEAFDEAAGHGRDTSGRFRTATDWAPSESASAAASGFAGIEGADGWTDWVPSPTDAGATIVLVRERALLIAGLAAGLALAILGLAIRRGRRYYLSAWLLAAGLATIWLPVIFYGLLLPVLAAGLAFTGVSLIGRVRGTIPPGAALALFLVLALSVAVGGANPAPTIVYLVPGPKPGSQAVLAPPELLDSLRKIGRSAEPAAGVMLTEARYEGAVNGSNVRWSARYTLHSFRDAAGQFAIALPDAQLLGASIDGRETLPLAGREPGQFEFVVRGRGAHELTLRFATAITGERDAETRCRIPELAASSCVVDLPPGGSEFQVISARGVQHVAARPGGPRLEADIGRASVIQLRWRRPDAAAPPRVSGQAVHLWEIDEARARLLSVFRLRLGAGSARRLDFDVPPDLELAGVSLRQVDDPLGLVGSAGVKDWRTAQINGRFRHRLEFPAPLSGQVQIELTLLPRRPLEARPLLSFPEIVGDFELETMAAARFDGLTATVAQSPGWQLMPTDDFLQDVWQPLRVDAVKRAPDLAFRRTREAGPVLRLDLQAVDAAAAVGQTLNWQVGPGRADLQATATWSEAADSGPLEWDIPASIAISDVRGDGVRTWTRRGSRLQVWTAPRPAGRAVVLSLTGSTPRPAGGAGALAPFTVPVTRPQCAGRLSTQLTVQAREGWHVILQSPGPFRPLPTSDLPGVRWDGFAAAAGSAVFALHPAQGKVAGDVLIVVESSGGQLGYRSVIDVAATPGGNDAIATVIVEVRRSDVDRPQLILPPGMRMREARQTFQTSTWVLDCLAGRHRFGVAGKIGTGAVPAVSVRGAGDTTPAVRRWLMLDSGVRPRDTLGLRPGLIPARLIDHGGRPAAAAAGWEVAGEVAELRLVLGAGGAAPARAVADVAAMPEGGRWLVRLRCLVHTDSEVLALHLPGRVELLSAQLDGRDLAASAAAGVALPPGFAGLHVLELVWRTPEGAPGPGPLPHLDVAGEVLPVAISSWVVQAPSGTRVESAAPELSPPAAALRRAQVLVDFAAQVRPRLNADAQARLRGHLQRAVRRAEAALVGAPAAATQTGPDGLNLRDWLDRLRAQAPRGDALPEPEPGGPYAEAFALSAPHYWPADRDSAPEVRIVPVSADQTPRFAASGALVLVLLVGLLAAARMRGASDATS